MAGETQDHNVYILGAGFSKDAGAPLIHDFLDRAREFFDDPDSALDPHERAQFEAVFKFKREVAKAREKFRIDLDDIEQLFGLVEMSQRLIRIPGHPRRHRISHRQDAPIGTDEYRQTTSGRVWSGTRLRTTSFFHQLRKEGPIRGRQICHRYLHAFCGATLWQIR